MVVEVGVAPAGVGDATAAPRPHCQGHTGADGGGVGRFWSMTPECGRCGSKAIAHVNGLGRQCLMLRPGTRPGTRPGRGVSGGSRSGGRPSTSARRSGDDGTRRGRHDRHPVQARPAVGEGCGAGGDGVGSPAVAAWSAGVAGGPQGAHHSQADRGVCVVRIGDGARRAPPRQGATLLPSTRAVCVAKAFAPPCAALRAPAAHARRHDDVGVVVVEVVMMVVV